MPCDLITMFKSSFCGSVFSREINCGTLPVNDLECKAICMHWPSLSKLNWIFASTSRSPSFAISVALVLSAKITDPNVIELIDDAGCRSLTDLESCIRLFKIAKWSRLYEACCPSVETLETGAKTHHLIKPGNGLTIGIEIAPCGRTNCGRASVHNVG